MALEIERKFLVHADRLPPLRDGQRIVQGYIPTQNAATVRVRRKDAAAFLTIKSKTEGISRLEFEYPIAVDDAEQLLAHCCVGPKIEKTRYAMAHAGFVWEVDLFHGDNEGLIIAEVELTSLEQQPSLPAWVAQEVSSDPRYYNSNLMRHPFRSWAPAV